MAGHPVGGAVGAVGAIGSSGRLAIYHYFCSATYVCRLHE